MSAYCWNRDHPWLGSPRSSVSTVTEVQVKRPFAELLAPQFNAEIVHTDDFASWDNPKNWWPILIDRVLEPIAGGAETVSYPRSQWWPDHHPEPVFEQPVTDVMVLEGVGSLRKEFRSYLALGVFLVASREVCLERGLHRDAGTGERVDVLKLWERYYEDEEGYFGRDNPEDFAGIVLDGTRRFDEQLIPIGS